MICSFPGLDQIGYAIDKPIGHIWTALWLAASIYYVADYFV